MKFYEVTEGEGEIPTYWVKQQEAHAQAKAHLADQGIYNGIRIKLLDVKVNQDTIVCLLNNRGFNATYEKTWRLSPRGAMVECNPEDL